MLVSIMALIGAGKSTLLKNLSQRDDNCIAFLEPTSTSEGAANNPFLNLYYEDPKRWSFAMQVNLLFERYKMTQEAFLQSLKGHTAMLDSTIYSDMAFALVQKWSKYFTDEEYTAYLNMHKVISSQSAMPDVTFWLEVPIDVAIERINGRGRECEANIPRKYLEDLYSAYGIVLNLLEGHTRLIRLDATKSADDVAKEVAGILTAYGELEHGTADSCLSK